MGVMDTSLPNPLKEGGEVEPISYTIPNGQLDTI